MTTFAELQDNYPVMADQLVALFSPSPFRPRTKSYSYGYRWKLSRSDDTITVIVHGYIRTYSSLQASTRDPSFPINFNFEAHFELDPRNIEAASFQGCHNDRWTVSVLRGSDYRSPDLIIPNLPLRHFRKAAEEEFGYNVNRVRARLFSDWENSAAYQRIRESESRQRGKFLDKTLAKLSSLEGVFPIKLR